MPTAYSLAEVSRGLTLVELLVALAVAAILVAIAVPSYTYLASNNRMTAELNALTNDLQFTRAEAIKEGQIITVCTSNDGTSCSGTKDWAQGWIVFANPTGGTSVPTGTKILRVQNAFQGADSFVDSNFGVTQISYDRNGFGNSIPATAAQPVSLALHDSAHTQSLTRCVLLNSVGRITTSLYAAGTCL